MPRPTRLPIDEYPEDLEHEEQEVLAQDDSTGSPPSDIVTFNELRSCADLLRMYKSRQLTIDPDFQRDIVWTNPAQSRFIDSLTKGLPIPSMCISLDYKTNQRLVIDGLQRMSSIIKFLTKDNWTLSNLKDIDPRMAGKKVSFIREKTSGLYDQVQNLTIPVTVLRCDYEKRSHMQFLFTIFHRLNTGGNKLTNQEIRNCIYSGSFNELLRDCAGQPDFRHLFGLEEGKTYRYAYEEFVLRVFAFVDSFERYSGNLSQFLNDYMEKANKKFNDEDFRRLKSLFDRTVKVIYERITEGGPLPKVSKATSEALFVGVGRNIDYLEGQSRAKLARIFVDLRATEEFSPENLKNAITTKEKLIKRMERAVRVFEP
ncbi:MAG: DUF262 domain-containing protein [Planctomycetaceae bacterium]